jgi:ribosome maturation factor RimP
LGTRVLRQVIAVGRETENRRSDRREPGRLRLQLEKIREAAERVARSEGLEVVDVEWKVGKQRFLRVYIDRVPDAAGATENGQPVDPYPKISHKDCERVSQQLSVILDVEELVPGPGYVLEVSSPGMDRALKKVADYERFTGRSAKVWTEAPVEQMVFFEGRLGGVVANNLRLELKGKTPRTVELPLALIRKAHLVVEF